MVSPSQQLGGSRSWLGLRRLIAAALSLGAVRQKKICISRVLRCPDCTGFIRLCLGSQLLVRWLLLSPPRRFA